MDNRKIKYLDPKNDLTFRKIFGEHPNIIKSFLNSLLPLSNDQYITELTYSDPGLIPELPELKHSIVDVRCTDNFGRHFIVEMQMYWTSSFKNRMLFNSGKAYVKQIDSGHKYSELQPVYGLSLVNDIFLSGEEYKDKFYHHYRLSHQEIPDEVIKGIELIFIELPKFKAQTYTEKKLRTLWLRFLTEIDETTSEVPEDLSSDNEIKEALEHLHVSAFTKNELNYYDKYWDKIRTERTALYDALTKGRKESEKALEQNKKALEQNKKALEQNKKVIVNSAKAMLQAGISIKQVQKITNLSKDEIEN